ncbi:hypothetical protein AAC387_Pa05g2603 [Persea americana]
MCYAVACSKCGKTTWSGCGRHVASVYQQIPQGQHCLCQEWPGIKIGEQSAAGNVNEADQQSVSRCTVL